MHERFLQVDAANCALDATVETGQGIADRTSLKVIEEFS